MAIGSLGGIVFQVSDSAVLTFKGMTREVSSRWVEHEVMGVKPKKEFLGAGNQKINLPITLSAALGVGVSQASGALAQFPEGFTMIFGKSPVVIATLMAVLLNLILPKEKA